MGNCMAKIDVLSSSDKKRLENANLDDFAVMMAFVELSLCSMREMERMYVGFDHIGPPIGEDYGKVAIEDIMRYMNITPNAFLEQIFTAPVKMESDYEEWKRIEAGGKKKTREELMADRLRQEKMGAAKIPTLTFAQFCMSIYMLTFIEMPSLAFNMYDTDGSGTLDLEEVKGLVYKVYGSSGATQINDDGSEVGSKVQQVLDGMDADHDGVITKPEFAALVHRFHYLLLPAFQVQNRCRTKMFSGYVDWKREEQKTEATKYTTLVDIVKRIDKIAQEQVHLVNGDIEKLKEKVMGESFSLNDVKDGDMLKLMAPIDQKSVKESKEIAAQHKHSVESRKHH
jgi:hypothetical protein